MKFMVIYTEQQDKKGNAIQRWRLVVGDKIRSEVLFVFNNSIGFDEDGTDFVVEDEAKDEKDMLRKLNEGSVEPFEGWVQKELAAKYEA